MDTNILDSELGGEGMGKIEIHITLEGEKEIGTLMQMLAVLGTLGLQKETIPAKKEE